MFVLRAKEEGTYEVVRLSDFQSKGFLLRAVGWKVVYKTRLDMHVLIFCSLVYNL